MTTWKSGVSGNWNDPTKWSAGVPGINDDVSIPAYNSSYVVTIITAAVAKSVTVASQNGSHTSTVTVTSGNSLTTSGAITLTSNTLLDGIGTINAGGGISGTVPGGSGTLQAGTSTAGGLLDVFGPIASGVTLAIASSHASILKIEGTATSSSAISLTSANQTLEIGAAGNLTINTSGGGSSSEQDVSASHIVLDGGSLTVAHGLYLHANASLTGFGVVDAGTTNGFVTSTSPTITASGGTLEFKSAVDPSTNSNSSATNFRIASGATLKFDAVVGSTSDKPTITFQSSTGSLDLSANSTASKNFHGIVSNFESGDQIKFSDAASGPLNFQAVVSGSGPNTITTITVSDNSLPVGTVTLSGNYSHAHFALSETGHIDTLTTDAACFMAGTMVCTPIGEVAVETLKRGDLVLTSDGQMKPVSWLGVQTISTRFADKIRVWPIRIRAGALAENVPSRDLLLSPDHAVLIQGALIQAGALVNGASIVCETDVPEVFTYYHVEVDDHSLILAENTPAETFVDNVDRLNFDNWAEHHALYPEGRPIAELQYPRAKSHRQVPVSMRAMLAERAKAIDVVERAIAVA